ncbi:MAG TPA: DUF6580 family putative transport protein [Chitinophagaceae bacterium]|jgi:hypothetical protein|nr:DUF6580 family putative transport protein [Chitinophagaceae bacterium]
MKFNKSTVLSFILLVVIASLYRAWPGRPFGFAPQIAMAIFGGAVIKDKRLAFILPLLSMLLSDVLYEVLYVNGLFNIRGFYSGQWINYILFAGLTVFGFMMKKINLRNVLGFTISGSLIFFLLSNFSVWIGGGGLGRPRTFDGLIQCYGDALAFHRDYGLIKGFPGNFIIGDIFFALILFGSYYFIAKPSVVKEGKLA